MQVESPVRAPEVEAPVVPDEVVVPETPLEAQVLELAADIIETEGWTRHAFAAWGNRCALGGIGAAMKRMVFPYGKKAKARRAAEEALADLVLRSHPNNEVVTRFPGDRTRIYRWNDLVAKDKGEVVRTMREAAANLTPRP